MVLAAFVWMMGQVQSKPYTSRLDFANRLQKVQRILNNSEDDHDPRAEIEALIGKPDDIWTVKDDPRFSQLHEIWCYGSNGHHTLPTLGRILLSKESGYRQWVIGATNQDPDNPNLPPKTSLIGEEELTASMRKIFREPSRFGAGQDSLWLIQVANDLMPLGKEKAIAVLEEYDRVNNFPEAHWIFWLARVLFSSKERGYLEPTTIPIRGIPKNRHDSPSFPILFDGDCPFSVAHLQTVIGTYFCDFREYCESNKSDWKIRTKKLRPPDDPFLCYDTLVDSNGWPQKDPFDNYMPDYKWDLMLEIFKLVRTAYAVPEFRTYNPYEDGRRAIFEGHHAEFLRLKCHWDEKLQMYVRGDGTYTLDKFDD